MYPKEMSYQGDDEAMRALDEGMLNGVDKRRMRALVVEDEIPASEELSYLIHEHSQIDVVDCLEDGLDVLKFLQEQEVDVLFLDINIPSLDGMMLAHHIGKFARKPYIVFTTAYKEHAAEAFELEAFDYILKPYDEKRIAAMLHKLELTFKRDQEQTENLDSLMQGRTGHIGAQRNIRQQMIMGLSEDMTQEKIRFALAYGRHIKDWSSDRYLLILHHRRRII